MNLDEIFNQKSSSPGFPRSPRSAISSFVLHVMRSLVSTVEVKQKARGVNLVPRAVRGVRRGYLADCPGDEVARGVSNAFGWNRLVPLYFGCYLRFTSDCLVYSWYEVSDFIWYIFFNRAGTKLPYNRSDALGTHNLQSDRRSRLLRCLVVDNQR